MTKRLFSTPGTPRRGAFTLIELLCVMAIIGLLASLLFPALGEVRQHADSIACESNLKGIGVAVQSYLQDHNFEFPAIETDQNNPVYPADYTGTPKPQKMQDAFGQYGVTDKTLQCPADVKTPGGGSYGLYGNSYDWKPTLDAETPTEPWIYTRRGQFTGKLSRIRQVFDDTSIHFGHANTLYADGHVVAH